MRSTNAYPPKFQNNTTSITIYNSALQARILPVMTFEFHCKTCNYTSREACNNNPKEILLWSSINSSKELVACVVCPGCKAPLVQCCFCKYNINVGHIGQVYMHDLTMFVHEKYFLTMSLLDYGASFSKYKYYFL